MPLLPPFTMLVIPLTQFPQELEASALQIIHHSTQALSELVNDVCNALHAPPVSTENAGAVLNGGPLEKQSVPAKAVVEVWTLQVCVSRLFIAPCLCVTARQMPNSD